MIKNSGDSTAQLTTLNDNLKQKEKNIEELQLSCSNLQQEINNLKAEKEILNKNYQDLARSADKEQQTLKQTIYSLEIEKNETVSKLKDLEQSVSSLTEQLNSKEK